MSFPFLVNSSTGGLVYSATELTAGTSGAVPTKFTRARDIQSITKGTHTYALKFTLGKIALVDYSINIIQATYNASTGACQAKILAPADNDIAGATKTITITFQNEAGTAVDMATGDILRANFLFKKTPGLA